MVYQPCFNTLQLAFAKCPSGEVTRYNAIRTSAPQSFLMIHWRATYLPSDAAASTAV